MELFFESLGHTLGWPTFGLIVVGVGLGLVLSIIPGLGGITGLTILLPLTYTLDFRDAIAMMLGLAAVTATGDSLPAILLGVPGTSAATATIVDGYEMTKRGEGARALGASYMSSALGGVFGAVVLALSIPVVRPLVLAFGAPELFMLSLWGLTMVASLASGAPLRGFAAGCLGLLLATVGRDPSLGHLRYDFGQPFLWDGVPIVPLALGLFAIPELIGLVVRRKAMGQTAGPGTRSLLRGQIRGIVDAVQNWWLVLRCSAIGAWVGFLPGVGGSVADWFAYAHARQTCKNSGTFGKGDVRGVIAPECSNNAVKGGDLIPTIAFGIPGSASMAILLGAFIIAGVKPGPDMVGQDIGITYTMIWSLVIANVLGAGVCLLLTRYLARIAYLPSQYLVATLIPIMALAAYVVNTSMQDVWLLVVFAGLGYVMKQFNWPRPPLMVGFVLGPLLEDNLTVSMSLNGWGWLLRPVTLLMAVLLVASLTYTIWQQQRAKRVERATLTVVADPAAPADNHVQG